MCICLLFACTNRLGMRHKNHFVDQLFMQKRDLMAVLTKWLGDSDVSALVPWEVCSFHVNFVDLLCGFIKIDEKSLNMRKKLASILGDNQLEGIQILKNH